jgi:hypothetical protein
MNIVNSVAAITVGQRWRCQNTGRAIVILEAHHRGIGPAWHYEDESPEMWRTSHVRAFGEWNRFVRLIG